MGLVNFVFSTISKCIEVTGFLLDLNFVLVHSLIRLLVGCVTFLNNLPSLLVHFLEECRLLVLSCLECLAERAVVLVWAAVSRLWKVLESLKMTAHLSGDVCLRGRELLQEAVWSVSDGCGSTVSQVSYLVTSTVSQVSYLVTSTVSQVSYLVTSTVSQVSYLVTSTVSQVSYLVTSTVSQVSYLVTSTVSQVSYQVTSTVSQVSYLVTSTVSQVSYLVTSTVSQVSYLVTSTVSQVSYLVTSTVSQVSYLVTSTVSQVSYLVNSVVNMCLLSSQTMCSGALSVCQAVSIPLQKVLELGASLLGFLYSSLAGTTVLLWTVCGLVLEHLFTLAHFLISTFVLNVYGLLLTASITLATTLYLHPEMTRRRARTAAVYLNSIPMLRGLSGSLQCLQRALAQLPGALHLLQRVLLDIYWQERDRWERLFRQASRLGQIWGSRLRQGLGHRDRRIGGDGDQGHGGVEEHRAPPDGSAAGGLPQEHPGPHQPPLWKLSGPGESSPAGPSSADGLLSLLKEQEERKKCVICQDCSKTVVLLPCRHLCLCKDCTTILLRQPVYLHNCPLCRHMILNTMDVYL